MSQVAGLDFLTQPIALLPDVERRVLEDGTAVLADSTRVVAFTDPVDRRVVAAIDGARTGADVAAMIVDAPGNFDVVQTLLRLQQAGWIEVARAPLAVAVMSGGPTSVVELVAAIEATPGLEVAPAEAPADLTVIVTADYLHGAVADAVAAAAGPVLLLQVGPQVVWWGPILVPGETACIECLAHRLRRNREGLALLQTTPSPAAHELAVPLVEQLLEYRRNPSGHRLRGVLRAMDQAGLAYTTHRVTRRPQCEACGAVASEQLPVTIGSCARVGDGESGFRARSAEDVLKLYSHHVSPITGVVQGIWKVGQEDAVHVARAPHAPVRPAGDWQEFVAAGRNAAGGKGTTEVQARASALAESLERYSSAWDGTEPTESATYDELRERAVSVLHPHDCMLFSSAQYAERGAINARGRSHKERVPARYDGAPIRWSRIWSLTRQHWCYVPTAYVYAGAPQETWYVVGESNGNAAGSSLEDATLQGFFELVERDSVALWWYNALTRPGVELEGIDDDYIGPLRDYFGRAGRDFWVLDLTADLEVPAFVCVSCSTGQGPDEVAMGFGAHLDARIAVLRAIAEMNQLMPAALREVERPDRLPDELLREGTSFRLSLSSAPYLRPDPGVPMRRVSDFARVDDRDLGTMVRDCQTRVEEAGMEMFVRDLTRPDIELPVVKVVVPGMRHFWPRFGPGRLYDVPVQLGWRETPLAEDELNPTLING